MRVAWLLSSAVLFKTPFATYIEQSLLEGGVLFLGQICLPESLLWLRRKQSPSLRWTAWIPTRPTTPQWKHQGFLRLPYCLKNRKLLNSLDVSCLLYVVIPLQFALVVISQQVCNFSKFWSPRKCQGKNEVNSYYTRSKWDNCWWCGRCHELGTCLLMVIIAQDETLWVDKYAPDKEVNY